MSLLEEALARQGTKHILGFCITAAAVSVMEDVEEVVELLKSPNLQAQLKLEFLQDRGVDVASSTLHGKLSKGCSCRWCKETFGVGGWIK